MIGVSIEIQPYEPGERAFFSHLSLFSNDLKHLIFQDGIVEAYQYVVYIMTYDHFFSLVVAKLIDAVIHWHTANPNTLTLEF